MPDRFFNLSLDLLCIAGSDGYFKRLNPAWEKTLGFQPSELLNKPYIEFVHPEDREATIAEVKRLQTGLETISFENRYLCKDGSYKWLVWNITLSPAKRLMYAVVRDITQQKQTEQALRLQTLYTYSLQERLQRLLSHGSAVLYLCKASGDFGATFISDNVKTQMGYEAWEFTEDSSFWVNHIHPEDVPLVFQGMSHLWETGQHSHEYRFRYQDGTYHWMHDELKLLRDEAGNPLEIVGCWRDITAQKQAELALKESEQRLSLLFEKTPLAIVEWNVNFEINRWNPAAENIFGYSKTEVMGRDFAELIIPEHAREHVMQIRNQLITQTGGNRSTNENLTKESRIIICEWYNTTLIDDNNNVIGAASIAQDITERQQAQVELQQAQARLEQANEELEIRVRERTAELSQAIQQLESEIAERKHTEAQLETSNLLLQSVIEGTADPIFVKDLQGRYLLINSASAQVFGRPIEAVIGKDDTEFFPPEIAFSLMETDRHIMRSKKTQILEEVVTVNGVPKMYLSSKHAYRDREGNVIGLVGISRDITELKAAESKIQESQSRLNSILNSLKDVVWSVSLFNNEMLFLNPSVQEVYGRSPSEFFQNRNLWMETIYPPDCDRALAHHHQVMNQGNSEAEYRIVRPDGEVRWIQDRCWLIYDETGQPTRLDGIITDITERKLAEKVQARLTAILEATTDFVGICDAQGDVLYINRAGRRMLGIEANEDISTRHISSSHPKWAIKLILAEGLPNAVRNGVWSGETAVQHSEGREIPVSQVIMAHQGEDGAVEFISTIARDISERKATEAVLRQSEARLAEAQKIAKVGSWEFDLATQTITWSEELFRIFGLEPSQGVPPYPELLQKYHPDDAKVLAQAVEVAIAEGKPYELDQRIIRPDGSLRYIVAKGQPVRDTQGQVIKLLGTAIDISDRKLAEAAMQASEAQYRRIVETATEGIWMLDAEGRTAFVNPQMASMLGYSVEEMLGQTLFAFMDAEGQKIAQDNLARRRQGISEQHDFKFSRKDGSDMWAIVSTNAIFDSEGNYAGALGMITDITERKQVESALQQREEQLRQLIQNMPVMMNAFDDNFSFIVWNRECERVTGYSAEEIVGNSKTLELLYPNSAYRNSILTSLAEKGNNYRDWELDITTKDGQIKTIAWSNISDEFPIPGWAVWGIGLDVTERKQAEAALAERARLAAFRADVDTALTQSDTLQGILQCCTEAVVEHLHAAFARIWTLNADEKMLELQASAGMYTHLNGSHSRIPVGQFKIGRIAQDSQPHLTNCVLEDPYVGDKEWAKREGMVAFAGYPLIVDDQLVGVMAMFARQRLAEPILKALEFAADEIAIGIKRKQAEEALRQSEARFRKLAQREELLNRLASDIRNSLDVDTILETAVVEIRNLLQIDRCLFMWYCSKADQFIWDIVQESKKSTLPSFVGQHPAQEDSLTQMFSSKEILCIDDLSKATDPALQDIYTNLGYTAILALPIETPSGTVGLLSCGHHSEPRPWDEDEVELLQAVTDQIAIALSQAELYTQAQNAAQQAQQQTQQLQTTLHQLQQTQAQLIQTEKMSSLGQMVAGVAHEINNPVNFIYGNLIHAEQYTQDLLHLLHLYQQHYPHPPTALQEAAEEIDLDFLIEDLPKLLGSMKMGSDRIRQIILSLRNFSRLDEADMKAVNIHEGIDNTLLILQNRLKAKSDRLGVEIIKEYGNLPLVECYAGQLNQVFMNILNNAIDALELLHTWKVETLENSTSPYHPTILIRTEVQDRDWIVVRIADNGPGMTEAIKSRLFDPFFTTKPVGKGTGLGLSISYQIIVEKHGGALKCISQPGQGSEFWIKIPISQGQC